MSKITGLDRRSFLKGASMTALAGAVTAGNSTAAVAAGNKMANGKYNLDEIYNRVGSNCYKWDAQIAKFGEEQFDIGMGIADMDFRVAPCVTEALMERAQHENWGYLHNVESLQEATAMWSATRHGLEIDPGMVTIATGVHPGLIAALHTVSPPGSKVLMNTPTYKRLLGRPPLVTHARQ